uniref:Protein ARV n=1 Tax=Angiostrongylus cantonensis TaxID=6313 RepID=A0A0K0D5L2_ANGCA
MSEANYMCVNCMEPSTSLYQSYSEGVIRLSNCNRCNKVVDKYVEYETVLVVIDLIIHNISAYRHLIYNMKIQVCWVRCEYGSNWMCGKYPVDFAIVYNILFLIPHPG